MKKKFFNRIVSFLTVFAMIIPMAMQFTVSAEETEKYPYAMFGRNGIVITATSNMCVNGAIHTNKAAEITAVNKNINGKLTTGNDIEKRVKHVYADTKIYENYFTENCDLYEEEYVYSELNIHINNPLFCYNNITLNGNVSLNSNLGTLMNLNVTGEVKNANSSVVYSKYGDITIENDSTANINGLIYAPLGTLTINSPNVTINGIIIADKVVINSSNVNINYNDNVARFIGTTSEVYDFSGLEYLPEEWLGDTDEDDLFDIYEKVIDTDPLDYDTDDDALPDGYEVITLGTDPLEIDTDGNGVSDADEDFDTDNLTNLGEYQNGTEPFNPDTDDDGYLDGDEVHKYGTLPLNPDTDADGLLDGDEGYDGTIYAKSGVYFDPLNPDTDGDGILDGDEAFAQRKQQAVETHDKVITEITVDMTTNGNLERNLTIESMYNIDAMTTNVNALVGEPFNFETPTSFEKATITFKIDKAMLGEGVEFDDLIILWYNEEQQIFEEVETIRSWEYSTISTTTTHFSQYMIVDSEEWYEDWESSFKELRKMWSGNTSYYKALNTILIVDCSWKMENADKISYSIEVGYNGVTEDNYQSIIDDMDSQSDAAYYLENYGRRKCNRAYICENIINNMSSKDRIALMMYGSGIQSNTGLTGSYYPLMSAVQNVNNDGGTMYLSDAVSTALSYVTDDIENMYRIVIITNGSVNYGSSLSAFDYSNVNLNIVSLGGGSISSEIESVAQSTGGDLYYGYPSSSLTLASGGDVPVPPRFIGKDSDGDGLPDIVELYGLKPNGQPINSDPENKHSDDDGLEDNEELHFSMESMTYELDKSQYDGSIFVWSDPRLKDTDGDGLDDLLDNNSLDSTVHEFIIYESSKNDEDLKLCTGNCSDDTHEDYHYSNLSEQDLKQMDWINWSDFSGVDVCDYEYKWRELVWLLSSGDMVDVAQDMIDKFMEGTGGEYRNSTLTNEISNHENTSTYVSEVRSVFENLVKTYNGNILPLKYDKNNRNASLMCENMSDNKVFEPIYNDYFSGLGICIDSLYGNCIEVTSFEFDGQKYKYTLHFTLYDIYGLNKSDLTNSYSKYAPSYGILAGFRSWYILQHWNKYGGQYKPFITYMEFDRTFEGTI